MMQATRRGPPSGCGLDAECRGDSCNPSRSHDERAAVPDTLDPVVLESVTEDGSADSADQMRPALAPIETGSAEHPTFGREAKIADECSDLGDLGSCVHAALYAGQSAARSMNTAVEIVAIARDPCDRRA